MDLLIQGAKVYTGTGFEEAELLLEDGHIAALSAGLPRGRAEVLNAQGCLLAPGFTDLHVHLRAPGYEAKETVASGTQAALAGGFTTVCSMPNLNPVPDELHHLESQLRLIEAQAAVRVLPYGAITRGEAGECLSDIAVLAPAVAGFSDDGRGVQNEELMRRAMREVAAADSFLAAHCEVEALLPANGVCVQAGCAFAAEQGFAGYSNESEWAEVQRDIALVRETGCRLHICHASAAESFALVRAAKAEGLPVSCEVTPHHLLLSCDDIPADDTAYKMNPPLRGKKDQAAALAAVLDGTVDAIATDHAPHTEAEKAGGFRAAPCGIVGLETAFAALYTGLVLPGKLPLATLLALLTSGPRRVLGEAQQPLAAGAVADFVLLDITGKAPVRPERFASLGRSTPFAGQPLQGWPVFAVAATGRSYRRQENSK